MSDAPSAAPPAELVVDARPAPGDSQDGSGSAMAPYALSALGAGALAKWGSPLLGLAGLGVAVLVLVVLRRPDEGRFVLRIEHDEVVVRREKLRAPIARIALRELTDVTLDRRSRPASGRSGATVERARLALERDGAAPLHVPEELVTALEAQEWLGKVRVFLRKHGWLPKDEREAPSSSPGG